MAQALPMIGSAVLSSVLGKAMAPKAPAVQAPATMPMADDAAVMAAKRRKTAEVQARSGRASTIFSDSASEKLGG